MEEYALPESGVSPAINLEISFNVLSNFFSTIISFFFTVSVIITALAAGVLFSPQEEAMISTHTNKVNPKSLFIFYQ